MKNINISSVLLIGHEYHVSCQYNYIHSSFVNVIEKNNKDNDCNSIPYIYTFLKSQLSFIIFCNDDMIIIRKNTLLKYT